MGYRLGSITIEPNEYYVVAPKWSPNDAKILQGSFILDIIVKNSLMANYEKMLTDKYTFRPATAQETILYGKQNN